jgi:hypothetical protein
MEHHLQEAAHQWLVPIAPELVVSVAPGGVPIIEDVAPRIAMWTGNGCTSDWPPSQRRLENLSLALPW